MIKPPIEVVRVSDRGKEILIKIKKRTGLQHWNEICRVALCCSLIDPSPPPKSTKLGDSTHAFLWFVWDPFDRVLIAQAILKQRPLVSADAVFDQYGVTRLWN